VVKTSCGLGWAVRNFAVLVVMTISATPLARAQDTVPVNGFVQPAPGRGLKIEVGGGRGGGETNPDGTFHFPAKGHIGDVVGVTVRDGNTKLYDAMQTLGTDWEMQIGPVDLTQRVDPSVTRAILWSLLFSVLAGLAELQFRSKAGLVSCFGSSSILYIGLLCFFNTLAAALAAGLLKNKIPGGPFFAPMFYALFGVFAFETVLSNTNVTIFEKGVLAFQEWTGKARDPAVASVQRRQSQRESDRTAALAKRLMAISDRELTTYVLDAFGGQAGGQLIADSQAYGTKFSADPKLYLALAFARSLPDRAASAVR